MNEVHGADDRHMDALDSDRASTDATDTASSFGAGLGTGAEPKSAPKRKRSSSKGRTAKKKASRKKAPARDKADEPESADDSADDGTARKRRRRGSRGGRRRKRQEGDAAEIDTIPGEDDDLDDARAPEEVDSDDRGRKKRRRKRARTKSSAADDDEELSDDDAEGEPRRKRARSKKKARKSSARDSKKSASKSPEEKEAEAEAKRVMTIAVNAVEPEERRVAVFKDDRIVDFLMTAESQKTLVNDIYRGRVVNLEPAIGAAFIDFGQGRNGFLHTSDVLPAYGEPGFKLLDLITASVLDEEDAHDADWAEDDDDVDPADEIADVDELDEYFHDEFDDPDDDDAGDEPDPDSPIESSVEEEEDDDEPVTTRRKRSLRSRRKKPVSEHVASLPPSPAGDDSDDDRGSGDADRPARKKRTRTRRKAASSEETDGAEPPAKKAAKRSRKKASKKVGTKSARSSAGEEKPARKKKTSKKKSSRKKSPARTSRGRGGKPGGRGRSERRQMRERRPIDQLLKVGDPVVVQVTKDAIGDKGPTLTTYISMPGRYLVLMPSMSRTGVSRKIPDEKERKRLKRILASMNTPSDMGVIVRTAGVGRTKADLQRDLDYLMGLWKSFGEKLERSRGPAPLYLESDVATRTLRDLFNRETKEVVVDDLTVFEQMQTFAKALMPEHVDRIKQHEGDRPLFQHCGIEPDFEKIFARRVDLPSGGSIVFDQAEALVAIDVNSGRTRTGSYDFEEIALKTNLEAVPEIARQIKLRDLGGIIVCDFIDMMKTSSNKKVEKALKDELSDDRARSKLGRISQFGLLELTRQRLGPGTHKKVFQSCPRCRGTGRIRSVESRSQAILRRLGGAVVQKGFSRVEVRAHPEVVDYLKEELWDWVRALEHRSEKEIILTSVPDQAEDSVLRYLRTDGREVRPGGRRKR